MSAYHEPSPPNFRYHQWMPPKVILSKTPFTRGHVRPKSIATLMIIKTEFPQLNSSSKYCGDVFNHFHLNKKRVNLFQDREIESIEPIENIEIS